MPSPYLFILEVANNHMGDVTHGKRIIQEMREACAGFDFRFAMKLQYRHLPDFIHPDYRDRKDLKFVKRFSDTSLSWDDYRRLKDAIVDAGFLAICTPWDEASVDKIVEHGFDCLKIPSCYLTDWPLAEKIATTKLPLIISTACESFEDIDRAVSFYLHRMKLTAIMHCVGEYPTADYNLQLNQIDLLKRRYNNLEVGYSTHESPEQFDAVKIALAKGATVLEKHVGVPTERYPLNAYSANPAQVRRWLEAAHSAITMGGVKSQRYEFSATERKTLGDLHRGAFARHPIVVGQVIGLEDVFLSIPGMTGQLVGQDLSKYTEFRAAKDYTTREPILRSGVTATDTRSILHNIVRDVVALLKTSQAIVPAQLHLEVSYHYGLDRFREFGSTTITVVNHDYCKRVILILPGQRHPEQWHKLKDETYHMLYGEIDLVLDGQSRKCARNDVVTIRRGVHHEFSSVGGAVIEEISSAYSQEDSYYSDPAIMQRTDRKTYVTNWMD
jgi:sialic acid synthase SpsE/mannose-6-phosphate isomerase-like protein (cupin superfamily)